MAARSTLTTDKHSLPQRCRQRRIMVYGGIPLVFVLAIVYYCTLYKDPYDFVRGDVSKLLLLHPDDSVNVNNKSMQQQQQQQQQSSQYAFLGRDGNFCPATTCPSNDRTTSLRMIHSAWDDAALVQSVTEQLRNKSDAASSDKKQQQPPQYWATVDLAKFEGYRDFQKKQQQQQQLLLTNKSSSPRLPPLPFEMRVRDPQRDSFISKTILDGQWHDPHVLDILLQTILNESSSSSSQQIQQPPVVVDVGGNIGYFSSLALHMGARVVTFEPFLENASALMSTIVKAGWQARSTIYLNAVSYEAIRVKMEPTNKQINLSNMHIVDTKCILLDEEDDNKAGVYGLDYMDAVSLDQVFFTQPKVASIRRIHAMKIDVETHEVQVINGAMHLLCNRHVDLIVMEVQYLKAEYKLAKCRFAAMQDRVVRMGFTIWDPARTKELTKMNLDQFPAEAVFVQTFLDATPAQRLRGTADNPCAEFDLKEKN